VSPGYESFSDKHFDRRPDRLAWLHVAQGDHHVVARMHSQQIG
jgi:hypothetical protein